MKKFIPIFISAVFVLINVLSVEASENILRGINIKGDSEAYTIELASTKPARMTKNIISANRVIVNLKNINAKNNISMKYGSLIDNVIVEPNGNNVDILIQGDNIACSSVEFTEPTTFQQIQDFSTSTVSNIISAGKNNTSNKTVQYGSILLLLGILIFELRFIKQKYNELKEEKNFIQKDIKNNESFKDNIMGFGNMGLKKPYTTAMYGVTTNPAEMRANYINRLKTFETKTLNNLMHNVKKEQVVIDKIINNKYSFGSLSNIDTERLSQKNNMLVGTISNPIQRSQLKADYKKIQDISSNYEKNLNFYRNKEMNTSLNQLY